MTDWGRERWRKLYLREPADQEIMAWQARGLRDLLIRIAEDDGRVARDVAALAVRLRAGHELAPHVEALLSDGFLVAQESGLYVRNLPRAQRSRTGQEPATAPRATPARGGGRWANTTPEQRSEAARRAASGRWGPRIGDASENASSDASTNMRHDASTHSGDASGDASSPRAVSGSLDPSQSVEEEEKREEERAGARAQEPNERASSDASTHRRADAFGASFSKTHPDDLWAFEQWQKTFGKTGSEFSGRRCVALLDRRRAGMTRQDVLDALSGAKVDSWVNGTKDGTPHDGVAAIFGDADRFEAFRDAGRAARLASTPTPPRPRPIIDNTRRPIDVGEVPEHVIVALGPRRAAPTRPPLSAAEQIAAFEQAERDRLAAEPAEGTVEANG